MTTKYRTAIANSFRRNRKSVKALFWAGVVLLVVGILTDVITTAWYDTRTWFPLDIPMMLNVGQVHTAQFTSNIESRFLLLLEVDRILPREAEQVLGTGDNLGKQADSAGFRLAWKLRTRGQVIQQGISDGRDQGYWSAKRGRVLGFFMARKGQPYQVEFDVLEDGRALQPYHPRAVMRVAPGDMDGYAIGSGLLRLGGIVLAILGGILLAFAGVQWWRDSRTLSVFA